MFISKKEAFSAKIQIKKHRWPKPLSCTYNLYAYGTKEKFTQSRQVSSYSLKKDQYLPYQSKNHKANLNLCSNSKDFKNQPAQPPSFYSNSSGYGYAPKPLDLKIIRNLLFGFNLAPIQKELSKNVSINSYVKSKSSSTVGALTESNINYTAEPSIRYMEKPYIRTELLSAEPTQTRLEERLGALTKTNTFWSNSTDFFVMTLPSKTYSFKTQKAINVVDSYFNIISDVYPLANNQNKQFGKDGYTHSLKGLYESGESQNPRATWRGKALKGIVGSADNKKKWVLTKDQTRTGSKTFLSYWLLPLIGLVALMIPRGGHSVDESRKAVAYDQKETSLNQLYKVVAFRSAPEQLLQENSKLYSLGQQSGFKKDNPIIGHFVTQKLNNFCFDTISTMQNPAKPDSLYMAMARSTVGAEYKTNASQRSPQTSKLELKPSNSIYTASNFALKTTYSNLLFKKSSLLSNNYTLSNNSTPLVAIGHKQNFGLNHKRADLAFADKEIKIFNFKSYATTQNCAESYKDVLAFLNNLIYGLNWNTLYPALYTNNVGAKICFEASMAHKCAGKLSLHKPTWIFKKAPTVPLNSTYSKSTVSAFKGANKKPGHIKKHVWLHHIEASYNLIENASRTLHSTKNNLLEFDRFIYGPEAYLHNNQKNLYPVLSIIKLFKNYLSQESFSLPLVGTKDNNNKTVPKSAERINYLSGLSLQNVHSLKPCFHSSYNMLLLNQHSFEASMAHKCNGKGSLHKPSDLLSAEPSLKLHCGQRSQTKLNKQKSKKPLFKKGFIKMHYPILTTSQQRLETAPQVLTKELFSNVSKGHKIITKNFGVALHKIGSDTINHVNPPFKATLGAISHNTNNQNNADAKLDLKWVSKNFLPAQPPSPKQSNSSQTVKTNISRIFSKYIRYIRNQLNKFLKLNNSFNKEVLYNYLPKNSNFQLAGAVVEHSKHQENLTLPPSIRISNINNKIYKGPEESLTSITSSKTIFQNVMPIVLQHKKFFILSSKARLINSDNAKAAAYYKESSQYDNSTFKVSDVTGTFQELNKYKKDMQKKRKAKKQRLEGRRKKKRKRFYPRPTWLRLRLGVSLYKAKTSHQSLGAALQASTKMAKYKGLNQSKHAVHIVKDMSKVISKNHFYKSITNKFDKAHSAQIFNNQNTVVLAPQVLKSGDMSKNNLKNPKTVLNFLNNYIQTLSKPSTISAPEKLAHQFIPVNFQVGTQQGYLTNPLFSNYQMAVNNTAYNNIVYNLWLASRKVNNGFSRAQLDNLKNIGRNKRLAEGYKTKPTRVGSAEAVYSYKKKVLINNMLPRSFQKTSKQILINFKNNASYAYFEDKANLNAPKKDINKNTLRDFWIWLYNLTSTNEISAAFNKQFYIKNLLNSFSIPIVSGKNFKTLQTNNINPELEYVDGAQEPETLSIKKQSISAEHITNLDANTRNSISTVGDSNAFSQRSFEAFKSTLNAPLNMAKAINKKTFNRVKWSLNRTNLWSSTNQRISFWATQKLRNQSKNNKTKYIEKQFKKQMNLLFANLQAKAFFNASDNNLLNNSYKQNFKAELDKTQASLAKNYKLSISQKIHQKQIKLSYITSGQKQNYNNYNIIGSDSKNRDQKLLVNTNGTLTVPNLLLSTVGARLTLALQNGLESSNKQNITGFITKPSSIAWFEKAVFDIPSKLSNQNFNNWNCGLGQQFNMPPLNANGFGGADSKHIWPVALCSLLLHFSALISLISISQIRCFIKFHFILLYKLSNIYLQIIYQNQKLITNFCSGLFFGQKTNVSTYGATKHSYTVQPSINSGLGQNLGVSKKPSIIMLQQAAKQNTNIASPNKSNIFISSNKAPYLQLNVKSWLSAERGSFSFLNTKNLTKRKFLNNLYSRASKLGRFAGWSINKPLSTIKQLEPSSEVFRLAKLDNSIKKIKTASRNYNPNYSILARFGVNLLPNQTLLNKLQPTQQLYLEKSSAKPSRQKDLFYYKQSLYKLSNFFITFFLYFLKKPKSDALRSLQKQKESGYADKKAIPSTKNQTNVLLAEYIIYKNVFQQKINKVSVALNYEGIGSIKKGSYETSLKIVDTFEYFLRIIYGFFEKPAELTMDWIAYAFLVEWSSDLLTFTPENKDKQNWLAFSKLARQNRPLLPIVWYSGMLSNSTAISVNNNANALSSVISSGSQSVQFISTSFMMASTLIFSQFLYKRILYLNDVFIEIFNRPDTDLINRQKKGTLFWDIWSDILIKAADQYNINVPSLSNIKEEQNLLIDKFLAESPTTFVGSKNPSKQIKTGLRTSNLSKELGYSQKNLFGFSNSALELESASFNKNQLLKVPFNIKGTFSSFQSQTLTSFLTQPAIVKNKAKAPFITEFITYQSKETDLFLDYHPPKSFNHLSSIQYYSLVQQPIGTLVCQIYAGILNKQISKNILVIGSTLNSKTYTNFERMQKTLLIQALAGETEIKIITDNANRYAIVNRGFAVGIKLLKDVFEALALNTPCLFLLEDIHLIGERRPLLISDHGDSLGDEMSKSTEIAFGAQRNGDAVHEKNQILYQYNRHGITHYQKPFKGDFSLSIPTNHFSFDLFFKTRSSNFNSSGAPTPTNPLVYGINFEDLTSEGKNKSNQDSSDKNLSSTGVQKIISQRKNQIQNKNYASSLQLKDELTNNQLLSPPSTSPFTVLLLKEQKKLKPKKIVKELPWVGLPSEQLALLPRVSYSVRAKVAALADLSFSNMSAKFDMITDLLVIIDSVRGNRGFVVFATTHLPHILDPALRRPGRLDETISIPTLSNIWNRWEFTKGPQPDILFRTVSAKDAGYMAKSNQNALNLTASHFQNVISASAKLVPSGNNLIGYQGTLDYLDFLNLDMLPNKKTNFVSPIITTLQAMRINKKDSRYQTKPYIKTEHLAACNSNTLSQKATSKGSLHKNSILSLSSVASKAKGYRQENKTTNIAYYQMGRSLIRNWAYTKAFSTSGFSQNGNKNQRLLWNILNFSPIYNNSNTTNSSTLLTETREFLSTEVQYKSIYSSTHVIKNTLIALISGKFSELFAFKTLPMLGLYGKPVLMLQQPKNGSKHSELLKATLKQKNPVTLYGIDQTWRAAMSLALSFVQKRYLYHKNLIVPKLLNFLDSTPLEEAPSPPSSNILIPAKRYENYKKVLKENVELHLYPNTGFGPSGQFLFNKVEKHLKQSFIQSIYKKASQESFSDNISVSGALTAGHKKSNAERSFEVQEQRNMVKTAQLKNLSSMDTTNQFVADAHKTTNINWYYENKLLKRHKNYLTNQWWTGQLIEHNAETLFLSDIDWRYTFYYQRSFNQSNKKTTPLNVNNKSNIQDILLDFPDSDQHYNPKQRRWLLNSGYWSSWFDFDRTLQTEILNNFIFECFVTSYNILNQNRELLDYSVTKYLQKGLIKEINMIGLISRLVN